MNNFAADLFRWSKLPAIDHRPGAGCQFNCAVGQPGRQADGILPDREKLIAVAFGARNSWSMRSVQSGRTIISSVAALITADEFSKSLAKMADASVWPSAVRT